MPKGTSSSNGPGGGSSSKQYRRFRLLFSSKMWFHQSTYSEHLTSVSAFGRLWWSESINAPAKDETSPGHLLSGMARWRRWNRQWGLIPCAPQFPRQVAAECPCATLHEDVRSGRVRYPCLTTPAPTKKVDQCLPNANAQKALRRCAGGIRVADSIHLGSIASRPS